MTWKILSFGLRSLNAMNNLRLLMTWKTLGRVLRALDSMNRLKVMDNMCHSRSRAQGYGCFEQLSIVNDMNDLISSKLRPLDALSSLGLWMIWMILRHELRVLDVMNDWVMSSWLKILWTAQGCGWHEWLRVMSLRLWMLWAAQSCRWYERLRILWAQATIYYEQLIVMSTMNDSWLWVYGFNFYE